MNWRRLAGKLRSASYTVQGKIYPSFSQAGEDQIIRYLFQQLRIEFPTYIDIGTNHPYIANNTYFFYVRGCNGVCIEPDPALYSLIRKYRKRDVVLNAGIGTGLDSEAILYLFPEPYSGWNTFDKDESESRTQQTGVRPRGTQSVSLLNINDVFKRYFQRAPNLLSIDVEGLDLAILQSMDFVKCSPDVICAETITFSMHGKEEKIDSIAQLLEQNGYFVFADTHINTIFCKQAVYKDIRL